MTTRIPRGASPRAEPPRAAPHEHRAASRNPSTGTSDLDQVMEKLRTLGLEYPAQALPELVEEAARDALSPLAFLDRRLAG